MSEVSDPLERALHWGALWDAVRETELSPAVYADFAIRSLPAEADLDITLSVLGRTNTALITYMNPAQRAPLLARYETLLADRMKTASSRDFRIAYFRSFTGAASTPPALAELTKLLAGTSTIPGVPLQQRDRWNIISSLVRMQDPEALSLLATEAQRDPSEDGKRSAYAARAGTFNGVELDRRLGRHGRDIAAHDRGQGFVSRGVKQFEAIDDEVGLSAEGHGGAPCFPAVGMPAHIDGASEESNDNERALRHRFYSKILSVRIRRQPPQDHKSLFLKHLRFGTPGAFTCCDKFTEWKEARCRKPLTT
jgi:hypothetical protein